MDMKTTSPLLLRGTTEVRTKGHPIYLPTTPLHSSPTWHPNRLLNALQTTFIPTSSLAHATRSVWALSPAFIWDNPTHWFRHLLWWCRPIKELSPLRFCLVAPSHTLVWGSPYPAPALYTRPCWPPADPSLFPTTRILPGWVAPSFFSEHSYCGPWTQLKIPYNVPRSATIL